MDFSGPKSWICVTFGHTFPSNYDIKTPNVAIKTLTFFIPGQNVRKIMKLSADKRCLTCDHDLRICDLKVTQIYGWSFRDAKEPV